MCPLSLTFLPAPNVTLPNLFLPFLAPCLLACPLRPRFRHTATECEACPAGYVSEPGSTECTPCPAGTYVTAQVRDARIGTRVRARALAASCSWYICCYYYIACTAATPHASALPARPYPRAASQCTLASTLAPYLFCPHLPPNLAHTRTPLLPLPWLLQTVSPRVLLGRSWVPHLPPPPHWHLFLSSPRPLPHVPLISAQTPPFLPQGMCEACDPGFYSDAPGSTTCSPCPDGSTSRPGASAAGQCVPCPAGKFLQRRETGSVCVPCEANTYSDAPGAVDEVNVGIEVERAMVAGKISGDGATPHLSCMPCPELHVASKGHLSLSICHVS